MFSIIPSASVIPPGAKAHVYLVTDYWDDWFSFRTMFTVFVLDSSGIKHSLGSVKIGEAGLKPKEGGATPDQGFRAPTLPVTFQSLSETHFSLGQDDNYYETLNKLDSTFRKKILKGLRDCAFNLTIFDSFKDEQVMKLSLLRYITPENVKNRLNRLARGNAVLTKFEFEYVFPDDGIPEVIPPAIKFVVSPESEPPTNVHVLIGRNGVGKTRCMQSLTRAILNDSTGDLPKGELRQLGANKDLWTFSGLVLVSFSIFDDFDLPRTDKLTIKAALVGLRYKEKTEEYETIHVKDPKKLAADFSESLGKCRTGLRAERWRDAVLTLSVDPLFAEADAAKLLDLPDAEWEADSRRFFSRLSSGHAIVLLTITRLVELVDERTLVILDEPEGHLHPPLLSAFIRSVSDLLVKRNGVAIVATHSPVVLQEIPRSCVWKLRRSGVVAAVERPSIETFGENVGVLTREVFGLEVTNAGFHDLIKRVVDTSKGGYESALSHFSSQLGAEAKAIIRGLIANRDAKNGFGDEDIT